MQKAHPSMGDGSQLLHPGGPAQPAGRSTRESPLHRQLLSVNHLEGHREFLRNFPGLVSLR